MKENKGFSLIELIIIIGLMGILLTFGITNSQAIFGYNAQECYKKVVSTISTGKVQVLSKSQLTSGTTNVKKSGAETVNDAVKNDGVYIEFYVDGNSIYTNTYVRGVPIQEKDEKVAGKGVVISYYFDDGTGMGEKLTAGKGAGLMLSYDRSTGAFLPYKDGKYIKEIVVSGGRRTYKITLMPKTGKVVKSGRM